MVLYNFKRIQVVPNGKDFIDIVLTRTQRKTPTVVHKGYPIPSIRKFYMRKVKFTQQTINDKFQQILTDFPILDEIHPFYADLLNVLYDKDHYKLALGQINNAKRLIENISRDSIRLLKYGDSLYRCKMLKRAALGRMVKILKRQGPSLAYLEEVRQHMARLPSIDPNTRTLLVCGYPNVGKSSFVNKVTRANVDVQSHEFTTKSLLIGHMYYKYYSWQVIDTPGILDHPLENRNTIEMQSITALAHLRCAILYFVDISEQCGYTIAQQASLFESILPLFKNKPLVVILNKVDARPVSSLSEEEKQIIQGVLDSVPGSSAVEMSSLTEVGISNVKEVACEKLLDMRVELKMKSTKRDEILGKTHVSIPKPRDNKERKSYIPMTTSDGKVARRKLEEYEEQQQLYYEMDPDYTGVDFKKYYTLENSDWNHDVIPEIMDGVNIFDYWDPDLLEKLEALEAEEEELLRNLIMDEDEDSLAQLTEEERETLRKIREKRSLMIQESRFKSSRNHSILPQKGKVGSAQDFKDYLDSLGFDSTKAYERAKSRSRSRGRKRGVDQMDVSPERRSVSKTPMDGFGNVDQKMIAERLEKKAYKIRNRQGKSGPGDNSVPNLMPRHLFAGKRSFKADRR